MAAVSPADFKRRLRQRPVVGPFSKTCDPLVVEALGHGGMDFVILDLEHGPNDVSTLGGLIRAAESAGLLPIVRVGCDEQIARALDLGAGGVQVPHVSTAARAREVIAQARFAPQGRRGVCRFVRAARSGTTDRAAYFEQANQALVVLQIEGEQGIGELPDILNVQGADVLFVGVYDLSQSLGVIGQTDHPAVTRALDDVARHCRDRRIACGTFVESVGTARHLAAIGMHYLCYSVELALLAGAVRETVDAIGAARGVE
ncbi:MAG: HpcH/HpaI aldolase/citrate lyase family protein [Phycisphaerae bacterium]